MKFGVFYDAQLPIPHHGSEGTRKFREAPEHVELADRLGIHYMWAVEHHFLEDHALSSAPEVLLRAVAAHTRHIRIGPGIVGMPAGLLAPGSSSRADLHPSTRSRAEESSSPLVRVRHAWSRRPHIRDFSLA